MGPGVAEIEMDERPSEVFSVYAADKTEPGAFNFPLWRAFVDAGSNTGLLINEKSAGRCYLSNYGRHVRKIGKPQDVGG